jgi:hypothetical protein
MATKWSQAITARRKLFNTTNNAKKGDATFTSCGFAVCLDVYQHLWCGDGGEADVDRGQFGQKEIHGSVQVDVRNCNQGDEQISKHSEQVHCEEKFIYEELQL